MASLTDDPKPLSEVTFERVGPALREDLPPPFTVEEYEGRRRRVKQAMSDARVDMIYVSDPADLCYLTGYQLAGYQDSGPREWVAATGLALHLDHDSPIVFDTADRFIGTAMAHVPDFRVYQYRTMDAGGEFETFKAFDYFTGFIVGTLKAEGWLKGTAGLQQWSYRPARGYSEVFQAALEAGGARVTDASELVARVRQRKSEPELGYMREAARIGDIGMRGAADAISAGATELEVWAATTSAMARHGGELSAIPGMVNSGPKSASLHGLASRRVLKHGDLVNIDMCGVFNRYHSNLGRTIALGEPDPATKAAIAKIPAMYRTVTAEFRPGMSYRSIVDLNEKVARELGIWDDHWWIGGYDLGIAFPPDWVGVSCFSCGEDPGEQTLEPGMVMNHEFNFYLPDGSGIRELIQTIIVTADGVEFPNEFPIDLVVVE
jgi:Xaa-Pro aminopeptidase